MKTPLKGQRAPRMLSNRPARAHWYWWHTLLAVPALVMAALIFQVPADVAAVAGTIVLSEENALYFRAGIAGLSLLVAFGVRGHPWWHTVICLLISAFAGGQITRALYTSTVGGIPLSLMCANLACFGYLAVLTMRPSVYEQLDSCLRSLQDARKREEELRERAHEAVMHARYLEKLLIRRQQGE